MNIIKTGALLLATLSASAAFAQTTGVAAPKPREVGTTEQAQIARVVAARFGANFPSDTRYAAAGPFRFASNKLFSFIDRSDVGSIGLENPQYGINAKPLDPALVGRDVMVPRALKALDKAGINIGELVFANFEDEYVGAGQPQLLPKDYDPRKNSQLVARSVRFERQVNGLPVFGSEVLVGLLPDGSIGRLRYHAPPVDARQLEEAAGLSKLVKAGGWKLPDELRRSDIAVLDMRIGLGQSGFVSVVPRSAPVVRVLIRHLGSDKALPLQSTRYAYFDVNGAEVLLDDVAAVPASVADRKTLR